MTAIHLRHCERSAAIQDYRLASSNMDRHGLRPRDDAGMLLFSAFMGTVR